MLTSRAAIELLQSIARPKGSASLLHHLGFSPPQLVDRRTRSSLNAPTDAERVSVASRSGILRAMVVLTAGSRPLREQLPDIAHRLGQRTPEFNWVLLLLRGDGREAALATWLDDGSRARRSALIWEPEHTRESDAETLAALAAAAGGDDPLVHLRWNEILGREALSVRFYRALERAVVRLAEGATGAAPLDARRDIALTVTSRLLFLSFLQGKGWLDGNADFLVRSFDQAATHQNIHQRLLDPLFFGTLNTPYAKRSAAARHFGRVPFLNGGLFARSPSEARYRTLRFRDEDLTALVEDVLTRYRFTAAEERMDATEAAIDPEILGRAFESLMASRDRRDTGAFYTPQSLVERTTEAALDEVFASRGMPEALRRALLGGSRLSVDDAAAARPFLQAPVRVLDPACGSGAFLVHLLDRLAATWESAGLSGTRASHKRILLSRAIFGVDVNPMAVWLCELRLWLSVVIDTDTTDPMQVSPLPNLDRNVRVGDALDGGHWTDGGDRATLPTLVRLRARYARASGRRKSVLARNIDRAERVAALAVVDRQLQTLADERCTLVAAARGRDLFGERRGAVGAERLRRGELQRLARDARRQRRRLADGGALPFRFATHFSDALQAGGFDLVIGNPPWVRLHRIPADRRDVLRQRFSVFRDASWQSGSEAAGVSSGFAAQVDLASLFAELSTELVRKKGVVALLLPMKLWRSLAGGGVRRLLRERHALRVLEDWSDAPAAFDAAVYPSLVVCRRTDEPQKPPPVRVTVHRRRLAIGWELPSDALGFDGTPGTPWVVLPPDARRAFARLVAAGRPLTELPSGSPMLGVKCGLNEAFLVDETSRADGMATVATTRGNVRIESSLLRPVLRGEAVRAWQPDMSTERMVWTHGVDGRPLKTLPDAARHWLSRWRAGLQERSDLRGNAAWWSLFRIDSADASRPRVVWADMSRGVRALLLPVGSPSVPLNTCYVLRCRDDTDAATLVALLNSPLTSAWLDAIAEPARGGYRRYLGWTMACLPVPENWDRARELLAPIGSRGTRGEAVSEPELYDATAAAYGLPTRQVNALVEWWRR